MRNENSHILVHRHDNHISIEFVKISKENKRESCFKAYVPCRDSILKAGSSAYTTCNLAVLQTDKYSDWSNYLRQDQSIAYQYCNSILKLMKNLLAEYIDTTKKFITQSTWVKPEIRQILLELREYLSKLKENKRLTDSLIKMVEGISDILNRSITYAKENPSSTLTMVEERDEFYGSYFTVKEIPLINDIYSNIFSYFDMLKNKGVTVNDEGVLFKLPRETVRVDTASLDLERKFFVGLSNFEFEKIFSQIEISSCSDGKQPYHKVFSRYHNCVGYVRKLIEQMGAKVYYSNTDKITRYKDFIPTGYSQAIPLTGYLRNLNTKLNSLNDRIEQMVKYTNVDLEKLNNFIEYHGYFETSYIHDYCALRSSALNERLRSQIYKYSSSVDLNTNLNNLGSLVQIICDYEAFILSLPKVNFKLADSGKQSRFLYYLLAEVNRLLSSKPPSITNVEKNKSKLKKIKNKVITSLEDEYINKDFGFFSNKGSLKLAKYLCTRLRESEINMIEFVLGLLFFTLYSDKRKFLDIQADQEKYLSVFGLFNEIEENKYIGAYIYVKDIRAITRLKSDSSTRFGSIIKKIISDNNWGFKDEKYLITKEIEKLDKDIEDFPKLGGFSYRQIEILKSKRNELSQRLQILTT